ncbi:phosphoenolpyruvate carboxylase [Bdellovibrio svalbardensis]|uniref:Phosphoenolpyruvate carboxylase n=1 Tax=Bdellovibrio svalbardensis TaxID=2972972 RepID=A0ABT6DDC6_9BACT|nr:phosphoenolpyruvate carboxylase [Bdellovibrio svalbardensis]MDG0814845.1 phosphoenolpyruvate carboxylase [Bdellovibrio svalbardensis]
MQKKLSPEFTHLVDWSVTELGRVIQSELGKKSFYRIEKIRRYIKSSEGNSLRGLLKLKADLAKLDSTEQFYIAHAFALMLEVINTCEAAYRIHRLQEEFTPDKEQHNFGRIIHVLTAHPTESRNPDIIFFFKKIQNLLVEHLKNPTPQDASELHKNLCLAWKIPISKQRKPTVMDEADYVYSLALQNESINLYLQQRRAKLPFYIRTWVGGDKDGHPGVDEKTMLGSLQRSRAMILTWLMHSLDLFLGELTPVAKSATVDRKQFRELVAATKDLKRNLPKLKVILEKDSQKVHQLRQNLLELEKAFLENTTGTSRYLSRALEIYKVFPALVVPLEIREDSSLVHEALKDARKKMNISRMLDKLAKISPQHDPRNYVRGFVLSQTESAQDIVAGIRLVEKYLGQAQLPVVPLFESAHSLENASDIVEELLKVKKNSALIKAQWNAQFEVMLGYSDSAKENGSFPSRFLIQSAIRKLENVIQKYKLTPIFFHGSGGSVERGGGSIQEQTEWWPASALSTVKMTIQGEVIYRNYTSTSLLQRQIDLITQTRDQRARKKGKAQSRQTQSVLSDLAAAIQGSYQGMLADPDFLDLIEHGTPYAFLKDLRFGSRPAKRQGAVQIKNLRAIPWVLCWTQTRALFPSWWGVGSYWRTLKPAQKVKFKKAFHESALFRSYVKVLGFTLEKIELDIFSMYLHSSKLSDVVIDKFERKFHEEYFQSIRCVREITGEKSLLWYRPWLETSIALRSPLIHPLNVLQLIALETKDIRLLRETVTGVASGMLTTG